MTATNHALTGSFIGFMVGSPWLAIPLAIVSHFALDMVPHFDVSHKGHDSRALTMYLLVDATLVSLLIVCLVTQQPVSWVAALCGAIAATLPDLMWLPNYFRAHRGRALVEHRHIVSFHKNIQWFERPIGFVVEVAWAVGMVTLTLPFYA